MKSSKVLIHVDCLNGLGKLVNISTSFFFPGHSFYVKLDRKDNKLEVKTIYSEKEH